MHPRHRSSKSPDNNNYDVEMTSSYSKTDKPAAKLPSKDIILLVSLVSNLMLLVALIYSSLSATTNINNSINNGSLIGVEQTWHGGHPVQQATIRVPVGVVPKMAIACALPVWQSI